MKPLSIKDTSGSLASTSESYRHEIVDYYDSCEIDYKLVWHLNSHLAMHYGYWEDGTKSLREALHNTNLLIAEHGLLEDDMQVLDAGCGVGGTAIHLSKLYDAKYYGISLSQKQIDSATNNLKKHNPKGRAIFSVQDYTKTDFSSDSFDLIYGIESVCHAAEKKDFLREAYRVLKPGGRLVVLDFFRNKQKYGMDDDQIVKSWADTWAVADFEPIVDFIRKGNEVGFTVHLNRNITQHIMKSARRLYWYFYPGWAVHQVLALLRIRNRTQAKNLWSTYYQYKALKKNLWSYHLVVMEK